MSNPTPRPMDHELRVLREEAAKAARLGGIELRDMFGAAVESRFKSSSRDFVTTADLASEKRILGFVEGRHPDHGWQSEEAGMREASSAYRWVIDPLDGTSNYAHGYPHFSVSVAVLWHGRSIAGAVYDPMRDECFDAAAGHGATLNGRAMTVSQITTLDRALVSTGFPYAPERRAKVADLTARAIEAVQMLRRSGSAALDLAYVAGGRSEAHWEFYLNLHDVAAGLLLVREAGGSTAEMHYPEWPVGYLATNGTVIADAVHSLIEEHFGAVSLTEPAVLARTLPPLTRERDQGS
ncbi:MAG: inositol monophosphatase family protein [Dehalococcoidia bacterium]